MGIAMNTDLEARARVLERLSGVPSDKSRGLPATEFLRDKISDARFFIRRMKRRIREEEQKQQELANRREGDGRGFDGEPRRTLCSELRGNDTVIPDEAWAVHGEQEEELDMGFFSNDPHDPGFGQIKHVELESLAEEEVYPNREEGENYSLVDEDPEDIPANLKIRAVANTLVMLDVERSTPELLDIVAVYLNKRMDGVVKYYFQNIRKPAVVTAVLNFVSLLRDKLQEFKNGEEGEFDPLMKASVDDIVSEAKTECFRGILKIRGLIEAAAISSQAKARLISKAQQERQAVLKRHLDAVPSTAYATLLGVAIFGRDKFQRFLRATV